MTTRRCAHGSNNAHNSRGGGVRLFGVCLTEGVGVMKKSASMEYLSSSARPSSTGASSSIDPSCERPRPADANAVLGYASDDAAHASSSSISRKKGVPWTEKEHRMFLLGLKKLGKGDWRGIARNFVVSRTPTQVASHAQKYFIRQSNASRRKRRSSLFDMPIDQITVHEEQLMPHSPPNAPENTNHLITLHHNDLRIPYLLETPTTKYAAEQVGRIPSNRSAIAMTRILPCLSSSAHTILVPKSEYFYQRRGDEESSRDFKAHSSCSKGSTRSRGGRRRIQVQH